MPRDKAPRPPSKKRMVWRITQAAPQGEMVDLNTPAATDAQAEPAERPHPGWATSSFELLNGVEITEEDPDTVPDELREELFKNKPDKP